MRHTKIIATLGPATASDRVLDALIGAGLDVARLNFSHGAHDSHREMYERIRAAAARAGRAIAVLQDLGGPKIRTGRLAGGGPVLLTPGQALSIEPGDFAGDAGRISTSYSDLLHVVHPGDRLLLDDGRIELRVVGRRGGTLETEVVHGGSLGEHKGINAPGARLPDAALTEKDVRDLEFGIEMGVDLVGVSFVQHERDLERVRSVTARAGRPDLPLVAKIERPSAIGRMDQILEVADGVMVARGDLGLELPLEQVPRLQKDLTRRARERGLPVIVATQVFESMRSEPRPTRAEVSDAANAVGDGADAIMLAGETAVGAFPVQAVEMLDRVIRDAERMPPSDVALGAGREDDHGMAMCRAAVTLATHAHATAIVAVTRRGATARVLSALRPPVPILAATDSDVVARRLGICRGVVPVVVEAPPDAPLPLETIERRLLAQTALLRPGALVVFIRIHADVAARDANFVNLQRLGPGG